MRKRSEKIILGIIILLAIAFIGKSLLSFSPTIPPFPVTTLINPGSITCPFSGGLTGGSAQVYYNGVFPVAYIYTGIAYAMPMSSTCVYEYPYGSPGGGSYGSINIALPVSYSNLTDIQYALNYDNSTLAQVSSELAQATSYAQQYGAYGTGYGNEEYAYQQLYNLVQSSISYIQSHESITTTTTTTSVTTTTTTTASSSTTTTIMPPPAEPPQLISFNNIISSIQITIQNFVNSILKALGLSK